MAAAPLFDKYAVGPVPTTPPRFLGPAQLTHHRFEVGQLPGDDDFNQGPCSTAHGLSSAKIGRKPRCSNSCATTCCRRAGLARLHARNRQHGHAARARLDTGNGVNGFVPRPGGGWLAAQSLPAGFAGADIDVVVLTHGHPDHIGGTTRGRDAIVSERPVRDGRGRVRLLVFDRPTLGRNGRVGQEFSVDGRASRRADDLSRARR